MIQKSIVSKFLRDQGLRVTAGVVEQIDRELAAALASKASRMSALGTKTIKAEDVVGLLSRPVPTHQIASAKVEIISAAPQSIQEATGDPTAKCERCEDLHINELWNLRNLKEDILKRAKEQS